MKTTNSLISHNGLVLQHVQDDALVIDGTVLYVNNLIDCFKTWNQKGSLHKYCLEQYRKEMELLKSVPPGDPVGASIRKVWEQLEILIATENEVDLLGAYAGDWKGWPDFLGTEALGKEYPPHLREAHRAGHITEDDAWNIMYLHLKKSKARLSANECRQLKKLEAKAGRQARTTDGLNM